MFQKIRKQTILLAALIAMFGLPLIAYAATLTFAGGNSLSGPPLNGATRTYTTDAATAAERNWTFTLGDANNTADRFGDFVANEFRVRAGTGVPSSEQYVVTIDVDDFIDSVSFNVSSLSFVPATSNLVDVVNVQAFNGITPVNITMTQATGTPNITGSGTTSATATATADGDVVSVAIANVVTQIVVTFSNADPDSPTSATNSYVIGNITFEPTNALAVTMSQNGTNVATPSMTALWIAAFLALVTAGVVVTKRRQEA